MIFAHNNRSPVCESILPVKAAPNPLLRQSTRDTPPSYKCVRRRTSITTAPGNHGVVLHIRLTISELVSTNHRLTPERPSVHRISEIRKSGGTPVFSVVRRCRTLSCSRGSCPEDGQQEDGNNSSQHSCEQIQSCFVTHVNQTPFKKFIFDQ